MNYTFFRTAICIVWMSAMGAALSESLISAGSDWRYHKGQAEPSFPSDAWRELEFNDAGWDSGPAPLRYGDGNGGTVFNDMRYNYSTLYLRQEFQVEDVSRVGEPEITVNYDDGFAVWINGFPVLEVNAPGNKAYNSFAAGGHESGSFETFILPDPAGYLRVGGNVIAVQVFNVNLDSSDVMLDLALNFSEPDFTPPEIVSFDPPEGILEELTQITVRFSEDVIGVTRNDLTVNGVSANLAGGSGNEYTWYFDPPGFGDAQVIVDPNHNITDDAVPPNRLDPDGPRTAWRYEIVDDLPPLVESVQPAPGIRLRSLSEVRVRFNEPVAGVDASDLLLNGVPALTVEGTAAGPYRFGFASAEAGEANFSWHPDHGIRDLSTAANSFRESAWSYELHPDLEHGDVRIHELLASNQTGLLDEDGQAVDWIELLNAGSAPVNLEGWSLSDDAGDPGRWVFPGVMIPPGGYLVVFASGKDRRNSAAPQALHTNFKLSGNGEYLGLFHPEIPRTPADELADGFPEQRSDYSYGINDEGEWRYFRSPSPQSGNGDSNLEGVSEPPAFSSARGFYDAAFPLILSHPNPDAEIRYTLDGSEPGSNSGFVYSGPLTIDSTTLLRAAAVEPERLPSRTLTQSYFFGLNSAMRSLPVLSLTTDRDNLFGPTGIMETNPRNTIFRGIAWERPVSAEWIPAEGEGAFQVDCGLRLQGGNYVRERYNPRGGLPFSKYSFRLYFRSDYGPKLLEHPLFEGLPVRSFDKIVLRAGMNDHTNPFVVDELVRRLHSDMGHVASHGNLVNLFLNGDYQGYYNPTERIDDGFLNSWTEGEWTWDVIAQFGEVREGDTQEWDRLLNTVANRNQGILSNYQASLEQLDMVNFVDYLLLNAFAGTGDWPHNNWRAARKRAPGAQWRFYVWDAEWAMGNQNRSVSLNTFTEDLTRSSEITSLYQSLRQSPEFQLLFADRVHYHLFNDGALTTDHASARFEELESAMSEVLPGMRGLDRAWIGPRHRVILGQLAQQGYYRSDDAPVFSQHGGRIRAGEAVGMTAPGAIYYTMDGSDPREFGSGAVADGALSYNSSDPPALFESATVKARSLNQGEWSALAQAVFEVEEAAAPLVVTEIMYQPIGGPEFEFIELYNTSYLPFDATGLRFDGIDFQFTPLTSVSARTRIVLASNDDPEAFSRRYPETEVYGYFTGRLSNEGETIRLIDASDRIRWSLEYHDESPWPPGAAGGGYSLERIRLDGDASDPTQWRTGGALNGTPGEAPSMVEDGVAIHEVLIQSESGEPGWVELYNASQQAADLSGWELSAYSAEPDVFAFPAGTVLPANDYLLVGLGVSAEGFDVAAGLDVDVDTDATILLLHDAGGERVDGVQLGRQSAGIALGRVNGVWELTLATPGAENVQRPELETPALLLNEWLANPKPGSEDWIELYNAHSDEPVLLRDYYLRFDSVVHSMPWLSVIPPLGHLRIWADEGTGPSRLDFRLPASGGQLELLDSLMRPLDSVQIIDAGEGVSTGRLPDGTGNRIPFPISASPGRENYIPAESNVRIEEVLARSFNEPHDWFELYNPRSEAVDLSGMSVRVDRQESGQWLFPAGAILAPNAYMVVNCDGEHPASDEPGQYNTGRSISSESGAVYLYDRNGRIIDQVEFGFQVRDQSIGRTAGGWRLLQQPSPGAPNGGDSSLGDSSMLAINEWLAFGGDADDWFEIYNGGVLPVSLGGLFLSDELHAPGRGRYKIPPLTFIGSKQWLVWWADGNRSAGRDHVNFSLDGNGENLALSDSALRAIDQVSFGLQSLNVAQGRLPDGSEDIVFLDVPTPETGNGSGTLDADEDGIPDAWESEHGLDPQNGDDAGEDADGDGMSNRDEYRAGTDPRDSESRLGLGLQIADGDVLYLTFQGVPGKTYRVEASTALQPGDWEIMAEIQTEPGNSLADIEVELEMVPGATYYRVVLLP